VVYVCQRSWPISFSVHFKLSCVRCVSDIQVASTLVWSVTVEGNDRSEKDYVTPFGSRDQFVTMVALYHWFLGQ